MTRKNRIGFGVKCKGAGKLLVLMLAVVMFCLPLCGCDNEGSNESTNSYLGAPNGYNATSAQLYCLEITSYTGAFVEDGLNEQVENVAAILVENRARHYLDYAEVTYYVDGKIATFKVTGLPAGKKAWVLEADRMKIEGQPAFEFLDCESTFRDDAVLTTELLKVSAQKNLITIENKSDKTLRNVCIYYKNVNSDGNYLGGITYMISFDTLAAGQTAQRQSAHFSENSQIVRYSFQDG